MIKKSITINPFKNYLPDSFRDIRFCLPYLKTCVCASDQNTKNKIIRPHECFRRSYSFEKYIISNLSKYSFSRFSLRLSFFCDAKKSVSTSKIKIRKTKEASLYLRLFPLKRRRWSLKNMNINLLKKILFLHSLSTWIFKYQQPFSFFKIRKNIPLNQQESIIKTTSLNIIYLFKKFFSELTFRCLSKFEDKLPILVLL